MFQDEIKRALLGELTKEHLLANYIAAVEEFCSAKKPSYAKIVEQTLRTAIPFTNPTKPKNWRDFSVDMLEGHHLLALHYIHATPHRSSKAHDRALLSDDHIEYLTEEVGSLMDNAVFRKLMTRERADQLEERFCEVAYDLKEKLQRQRQRRPAP